jgi:hypothetical protein
MTRGSARKTQGYVDGLRRIRSHGKTLMSVLTVYLIAILLLVCLNQGPASEKLPAMQGDIDATVLLSTIVAMYTFFLAAYGALASELVKKRLETWTLAALLFILGAVLLDLSRLWSATGDLLATTLREMTKEGVDDAAAEFQRYLATNALVLIFALLVICAQRSSPEQAEHSVGTKAVAEDDGT